MDRFGCVEPIVWNQKTKRVVGGHQRLRVLLDRGETEADVVVVNLSVKDEKALNVALNSPAIQGEFTSDLQALLDEICGETPDLYDALLLDELRTGDSEPVAVTEDEVPDPPVEAITQPGDLWLCGEHRVLCGDSTKAEDVGRVMAEQRAAIVATDPPYGVDFKGAKYNPRAKPWAGIAGDKRQGDELTEWLSKVLRTCLPHVMDDAVFYVWTAPMQEGAAAAAMMQAGLHIQSQIIWVKNAFALGQADYQWRHEPCWYAYRKGERHRWNGGRDKSTVWEVTKVANQKYEHPHQKPVELFTRTLQYHTQTGEILFDPFLGSGTTMIAAEQLGRRCYGIEIASPYVDVCCRRYLNQTGQSPVRESDGAKFADLIPDGQT
jgi:DNA modification methylase